MYQNKNMNVCIIPDTNGEGGYMEKIRKTILLGVKNNQIITADVEVRDWNGFPEFSASFNQGEVFNVDTIDDDYKRQYAEDYWDCLDDAGKLRILEDGYYTKDEALQNIIDEGYYGDYHDFIDVSCTDYELTHNGKTINFDTIGCGQYDVREDDDFEDMIFTDEKMFNNIMYFWNHYHLKQVTDDQVKEIIEAINEDFEEYSDGFDQFIINNINWEVL